MWALYWIVHVNPYLVCVSTSLSLRSTPTNLGTFRNPANPSLTRSVSLGSREEKHGRFVKLPQFPRNSVQSHATKVYKGPIPPPFPISTISRHPPRTFYFLPHPLYLPLSVSGAKQNPPPSPKNADHKKSGTKEGAMKATTATMSREVPQE